MGAWSPDSKSHVAHMSGGDFRSNEQSVTIAAPGDVRIELVASDGRVTVLKERTPVLAGEIIDATEMSVGALKAFLESEMEDARKQERALLAASEGDHDEGVGPDHLRSRREGVLQGRFRQARRRSSTSLAST